MTTKFLALAVLALAALPVVGCAGATNVTPTSSVVFPSAVGPQIGFQDTARRDTQPVKVKALEISPRRTVASSSRRGGV